MKQNKRHDIGVIRGGNHDNDHHIYLAALVRATIPMMRKNVLRIRFTYSLGIYCEERK